MNKIQIELLKSQLKDPICPICKIPYNSWSCLDFVEYKTLVEYQYKILNIKKYEWNYEK